MRKKKRETQAIESHERRPVHPKKNWKRKKMLEVGGKTGRGQNNQERNQND